MRITLNEDPQFVEKIRAGLRKKELYCPCRLEKSEDNICICKEFRARL